MRYGLFTTAFMALAVLATSPVLAREARIPTVVESMELGPVAPPPMGYIEFCQREAADCPMAAGASTAFDKSYWNLAFQQAQRSKFGAQKPASVRGFFRGFRTGRRQPVPAAAPAGVAANEKAIVLSRTVWAELERVNTDVNASIIATPDEALYDVDDYWSLPTANRFGRRRGDCEDYVLEKRHELLQRGYPQAALSIALVRTRWGEHHAVLIVETTSGAYVMDSLSPWIQPWSAVDYQWIVRQSPADPSQWVEVVASPHAKSWGPQA